MLTILKAPALEKVWINADAKIDPRAFAAFRILNNHLESKNIADCMDELIEAGLKEYAKL
jgi:hypothetical protein